MSQKTDYRKGNFVPDRENSTFFHNIHLLNGSKITSIPGWSCRKGFTEPKNKSHCLGNLIVRLYRIGYLRRESSYSQLIAIDFYWAKELNESGERKKVCTVTYDDGWMESEYADWMNMQEWLNSFYDAVHKGLPIHYIEKKFIRKSYKLSSGSHQDLDYKIPRFSNFRGVHAYVKYLQDIGYSKHQAENWRREYIAYHEGKTLPQVTVESDFDKNRQRAQKHKWDVEQLNNKMNVNRRNPNNE